MADVSVLDVELFGRPIGSLTSFAGDRTLFTFNEDYVDDPDRPTLGLNFKDEFGELRTNFRPYRMKLMPFFSNLLPEGHLRKYLAEQASVNAEREFLMLQALGRDLPGAITVNPANGENRQHGLRVSEAGALAGSKGHLLRFSLAGVQLKFSALETANGGLTIPASGVGGNWIVKLPSSEFSGVPENEYSMMHLARMLGMDVPRTNLIDIDDIAGLPVKADRFGRKALAAERFDRLPDGGKVHVEDFAQVFGVYGHEKYERANLRNVASVIANEGSDEDIEEFVRRLTFNTLIGNGDMHLKNWSLIYPDRRNAALAPAYDFVSTVSYIPGDNSALKYSRKREFHEFDEDEISHFAAKASLPGKPLLETVRETTSNFIAVWRSEKDSLPMQDDVRTAIDQLLPTLPLTRSS